jgi:hypothetical protein
MDRETRRLVLVAVTVAVGDNASPWSSALLT